MIADNKTYRRQKQQMLVIALHTGLAVFTYLFHLVDTAARRACAVHRLEVARDMRASCEACFKQYM